MPRYERQSFDCETDQTASEKLYKNVDIFAQHNGWPEKNKSGPLTRVVETGLKSWLGSENAPIFSAWSVSARWCTRIRFRALGFARGNVPLCIIARKRFARKRSPRYRTPARTTTFVYCIHCINCLLWDKSRWANKLHGVLEPWASKRWSWTVYNTRMHE